MEIVEISLKRKNDNGKKEKQPNDTTPGMQMRREKKTW